MVERRSPKPTAEVRFLVGPQTRKTWSAPGFSRLREAELCSRFYENSEPGSGLRAELRIRVAIQPQTVTAKTPKS